MRYRVEWTNDALEMLDNIRNYWSDSGAALSDVVADTSGLRRQELQSIDESHDDIEQLLQGFPLVGRRYRNTNYRILPLGPLSVGYRIIEAQRLVLILVVSYDNRRN